MGTHKISLKSLFESGAHYGHLTRYREPKMDKYIFGQRSGINIINLEYTAKMFQEALAVIERVVVNGGKVLFVGTKFPARKIIKDTADSCKMPYVNYRWLGGMLTNHKTIKQSIRKLHQIEKIYTDGTVEKLSKKETLSMERKLNKLQLNLGGIRDMDGLPELLFVIDAGQESIAIQEANRLGIPVVAIVDTNGSPDDIDYVIPGNDDSMRAIKFYMESVFNVIDTVRQKKISGTINIEEESFVEIAEDAAPKPEEAKDVQSPEVPSNTE